jgi:hypothetical protein
MLCLAGNTTFAGKTEICPNEFNIVPNSKNDQTSNIQKYLDAIYEKGGGPAKLEGGQYIVKGSIAVPPGVSLEGIWSTPHHSMPGKGTVIKAYNGRGTENGAALFELRENSSVRGLTIIYPEQKLENIQPYPWSIHGQGMHNTIENVTLVNSYQGICIGPEENELHSIRNVFGCVLRRGVKIASCTDIGRIENVHFNPHYWSRSGHDGVPKDAKSNPAITVAIKTQKMLEAFIFERTDWEYVLNTFVFGAKVGYLFTGKSENEACNGQFSGIGADMSQYCVVLERVQPYGILITNGEFVSGILDNSDKSQEKIGVLTKTTFKGSLQMSNCSFWGAFTNMIRLEGDGFVTLNQGTILNGVNEGPLMDIRAGRANVSSYMFKMNNPASHIYVGPAVKKVIVSNNFAEGGVKIENKAGDRLISRDNE